MQHERRPYPPESAASQSPSNVVPTDDAPAPPVPAAHPLPVIPPDMVIPPRGCQLPEPQFYIPTGFNYVDRYIIGQCPGKCHGLIGGLGNETTTAAIGLAVQNAKNFAHAAAATGNRPRLSIYVTYDGYEETIKPRVWANATMIPQQKLQHLRGWRQLTTQANLEPYEHMISGNRSSWGTVLSETERWDLACSWINRSFVLLDMSGGGRYGNAGDRLVDGLVETLQRRIAETGEEIGAIHIDSAVAMCFRHMNANDVPESRLTHCLGNLVRELRQKIAGRFNCIVWIMHQAAPRRATTPPTLLPSHTDSSASCSFASRLEVCGCFGTRDRETGCMLLNWSIQPYEDANDGTSPILMVDDTFCRLIDVSDQYVADSARRRIIPR